jgi:Txe/YoeB family toxin of Txe-Axe toxin-antitoxin module
MPTHLETIQQIAASRQGQHHPDAAGGLKFITPVDAKAVLKVYELLSLAKRQRFTQFSIPEMVSLAYEIRSNQKRRLEAERREQAEAERREWAKNPAVCPNCGKRRGTCECDW